MSYDLYVDKPKGDVVTQLRWLAGEENSVSAAKKFVELVHGRASKYDQFIEGEMKTIEALGLLPSQSDLSTLPFGSWFIQFTFTLAKPWLSKDDDPFYVAESVNPVRKDKVFKVPMLSAASWKGLLRWTLMHTRLAQHVIASEAPAPSEAWGKPSPEAFATERFAQTLLFGDEQGEEPAGTKGFAKYVDALKPEARTEYERLLREYYKVKEDAPLPHHSGRLMFCPTFFDGIDVEVINPHSRETKAGRQPIYLESVPIGAKAIFTLLYVPLDRVGKEEAETCRQALDDLQRVAEGLQALFTVYGFGAKTSSGFGLAADGVENSGRLALNIPDVVFPQDGVPQVQKPDDEFQKYLDETGQVKAAFKGGGEGGLLSNNEYKQAGEQGGGGSLSEFKQFRNWYGQFGEEWQAGLQHSATPTDSPETPFESLSQLVELCQNLQSDTTNGGAA